MSATIIGLHEWFQTPVGRYLLDWERQQMDAAVADIFGYHALQLGMPALDALQCNRMPSRWLADCAPEPFAPVAAGPAGHRGPHLHTDCAALPFAASSIDLVVLPHTLEFSSDPHATLREVARVLVPEGRLVVAGLNPASLWGVQQRWSRLRERFGLGRRFYPPELEPLAYWRLRDWLRLLDLEVEYQCFGCYRPGLQAEHWLQRFAWLEQAGSQWWPILGGAYFLVAVKRVRGMRLLEPAWKGRPVRAARPLPLGHHRSRGVNKKQTD